MAQYFGQDFNTFGYCSFLVEKGLCEIKCVDHSHRHIL